MHDAKSGPARKRAGVSRRKALKLIGAAGVAAAGGTLLGGAPAAMAQTAAAPAVRKKVKLTYWNWADNPVHQKISTDSVEMFNKSQNFIEVEVDATMAVMESRKKLVTSFAAGAAPDVAMMVQYWAQDYYDNGILHPIEDYFKKWDAAPDFLPERDRAGAFQTWPADSVHAANEHSLFPVLSRGLARGSETASRR